MSRRPVVALSRVTAPDPHAHHGGTAPGPHSPGGTAPGRHWHRGGTASIGFTALDGGTLELSWDHEQALRDPRALAATVNDVLMIHGITSVLALDCSRCEPVRTLLERHYAQAFSLRPPAGAERGGVRLLSCSAWSLQPARVTPGRAVGINIGQSYIKAVAVRGAGEVEARERRPSGHGHPQDLVHAVMRLLSELGAADPGVAAIGISTGGIVTDAAIWPGSGITAGLDRAGSALVRALPERVAQAFGKPVLVVQDVKAKAYFHSATAGAPFSALLLDIGTSVGGCHVDGTGRIPTLLNQVGRVAFDLSPEAPARPDGQGSGLLSQYLSAAGLVRHLRRHGFPVESPTDLERLFAIDHDNAAESARAFLADHLLDAAELLRDYYEFGCVVVTGGLAANRTIDLAGAIGRRIPPASMAVTTSPEPVFDSCIGAAYGALAGVDH